MKPNLALILTLADITVLLRIPRGWRVVGSVPVGAPDMTERLGALRDAAQAAGAALPTCKLILPDDQIMYTVVASPGRDPALRDAAIRDALDQLTPYPLDDLAHAWEADGDVLHVAVIARETLQEAEDFALAQGFQPLSFVAAPQGGSFTGEPFFGETQFASFDPGISGKVLRDLLPTLANRRLPPLVDALGHATHTPPEAEDDTPLPVATATGPDEPLPADVADPDVIGAEQEPLPHADAHPGTATFATEPPLEVQPQGGPDTDAALLSDLSPVPVDTADDGLTSTQIAALRDPPVTDPAPTDGTDSDDPAAPPARTEILTDLADEVTLPPGLVAHPQGFLPPDPAPPGSDPTLPPLAARARLAAERSARNQNPHPGLRAPQPARPDDDQTATLPPLPRPEAGYPSGPAQPSPLDVPGVTRTRADEPMRPVAASGDRGQLPPPPALPPPALAAFLAKRGATLPPGAMRAPVPPVSDGAPPLVALPFATRRPQSGASPGTAEDVTSQIPTRIASLLQKPALPPMPRPVADARVTAADLPDEKPGTPRASVLPRFGRSTRPKDDAAPSPTASRLGSLVGALRRPPTPAPVAPARTVAAPIPFPVRPTQQAAPDAAPPRPTPAKAAPRSGTEAPATNAFGARKKPASRSGMTGLVLTAVLVAALGAVGLWSAMQGPDTVADVTDQAAVPASGVPAATQPPPAPPEVAEPVAPTTAAPAPTGPDPVQAPPAAPPEAPSRPLVASDFWTDAPASPGSEAPDASPGPDIPVASGRPDDLARPSLADPPDAVDTTLAAPMAPPPPGVVFRFDERGLVIATPDGAVTPEGSVVILGRPAVTPPGRPVVTAPDVAVTAPEPVAPDAAPPAAPVADAPAVAEPAAPQAEDLVIIDSRPPVVPPGRPAVAPAEVLPETVPEETPETAVAPPPVALPGIPALRPPPRPASLFPEPVPPLEPGADDAAAPSTGSDDFALLTVPDQGQSLLSGPSATGDADPATALDRALLADPALQGFRPRPRGPVPEGFTASLPEVAAPLPPPDPALAGAQPRPRPAAVAGVASQAVAAAEAEAAALADALDAASDLAVDRSPVPPTRPTALAAIAAAAEATAAARATSAAVIPVPADTPDPEAEAEADGEVGVEVAAVAPAPSAAPSLPSRANVAAAATAQNAIQLNAVNLIGIFGSASDRRALVRLPSGRMVRVQVGERLDGGQVAAISDGELRYVKNGRNVVLRVGG